ncbi:MAG: hypothetical protein ACMXYK_04750 [Candidatus Woesearchaeota archaeon]
MKFFVGDLVTSVGGNFIEGVVLDAKDYDETEQDLTIRWTKSIKGDIDITQERSSDTVRKL